MTYFIFNSDINSSSQVCRDTRPRDYSLDDGCSVLTLASIVSSERDSGVLEFKSDNCG